jgi:CDP-paratose 2-epimerase
MHPADLASLIATQIRCSRAGGQRIYTAGGGISNAMSLRQLHDWCDARFEARPVEADPRTHPYDIPWVIMDNSDATRDFGWTPSITLADNLERIARHAEEHPDWLEQSGLR